MYRRQKLLKMAKPFPKRYEQMSQPEIGDGFVNR